MDVDECTETPDVCGSNATCTNSNGSFMCTCNPGYTRNGTVCSSRCGC
ncbi:MAG: hypothetical protein HFP76_00920 [Methylococcales symbiont of Iophon sp. n. MRB-2018]|nr:MAG: hypothetical protein HFP76_00920 [Methylococcales symbiont of Iophon sp. n. MRB-2018]